MVRSSLSAGRRVVAALGGQHGEPLPPPRIESRSAVPTRTSPGGVGSRARERRMIPLVPSITRFARVPVPHTNEATYALDASGNEWIAKREADMGCEALLAEALTWLLARRLGVRVPDAAFCDDPGERAWLSRRVPDAGHWTSSATPRVANVSEAAAIIALDAIVFNEARHARNLLLTGEGPDSPVIVWAIDADEARIGHVDDFGELGGAVPDPRIHAAGFPAARWRAEALLAAKLAADLPRRDLAEMVHLSCALAREPRAGELVGALADRCARAASLTSDYILRLEARP